MSDATVLKCERCLRLIRESDGYLVTRQEGRPDVVVCQPCGKAERMEEYRDTAVITTGLMTDAVMCQYHIEERNGDLSNVRADVRLYYETYQSDLLAIAHAVEAVEEKGREFENKHWLPRLRTYYRDSSARGHEYAGDGWQMLMWGSAGRVLVTFRVVTNDGGTGESVTLIFDDSSTTARGGVQGIDAKRDVALWLIQQAIDGSPKMKACKSVTLAGL